MTRTQQDGQRSERQAEDWLQSHNLILVARNHRCRQGEIDLIMRDGDTLVFIEVRLRRHTDFGGAIASVDRRKQQRLVTAARHWLHRHPWEGPCRFDVIGLDGTREPEWIRNAFNAG